MKRAGTPQERALAQMKLKAAATASRSAALFQKSVASASESRPTSKRGKKTKKKKRLYKRPKQWEECWVDVRKKQDAFGQKWKVWPSQVPRRAVTLLGTCLYVEPETAKASNGWWAPKRTVCLGEENEKIDQIPPEWLTAPPNKYDKHIKAAAKEEDWLLEVSVERKMKALCRASNALQIFNQYDDDGSGELDGNETASVSDQLQRRVDGVNATRRHRDAVDVAVRAPTRLVNAHKQYQRRRRVPRDDGPYWGRFIGGEDREFVVSVGSFRRWCG